MLGEDSTVVVIGVGGLGHLAVQILRATTPSRILAVDVREEALALAHNSGAHYGTSPRADTVGALKAESGGPGPDAVLDFVGSTTSMKLATDVLRSGGALAVVGSGGGRLTVRKPGVLPPGCTLSLPFWGTPPGTRRGHRVGAVGRVRVATEQFPLSAAPEAFERLRQGRVRGRAVLTPE